MAYIELDGQRENSYELHLTDEETVVLYSVLLHIGGQGKTRSVVDKILTAFENGGIRYSDHIKGVIDEGQLKFRD